jgi:hypothetical protein
MPPVPPHGNRTAVRFSINKNGIGKIVAEWARDPLHMSYPAHVIGLWRKSTIVRRLSRQLGCCHERTVKDEKTEGKMLEEQLFALIGNNVKLRRIVGRRPPASEPAKVQLWRPTAIPRRVARRHCWKGKAGHHQGSASNRPALKAVIDRPCNLLEYCVPCFRPPERCDPTRSSTMQLGRPNVGHSLQAVRPPRAASTA